MFADYRVPQALAYLGVLRYSEKLLKILKSGELMESGSEAEVALRGFSIRACDVRSVLKNLSKTTGYVLVDR